MGTAERDFAKMFYFHDNCQMIRERSARMKKLIVGLLLLAGCAPAHVEYTVGKSEARLPSSFELGKNTINVFVQPYFDMYYNGNENLNFVRKHGILPVGIMVANNIGDVLDVNGLQAKLAKFGKVAARIETSRMGDRINHAYVEDLSHESIETGEMVEGTAFFEVPKDVQSLDGFQFEFDITLSDGKKHIVRADLGTDKKTVHCAEETVSDIITSNIPQ